MVIWLVGPLHNGSSPDLAMLKVAICETCDFTPKFENRIGFNSSNRLSQRCCALLHFRLVWSRSFIRWRRSGATSHFSIIRTQSSSKRSSFWSLTGSPSTFKLCWPRWLTRWFCTANYVVLYSSWWSWWWRFRCPFSVLSSESQSFSISNLTRIPNL